MMDFPRALAIVLKEEGGYVDDPDDPGGATNFGVTQKRFDEWLTARHELPRPVATITTSEKESIYLEIWTGAGCDRIVPLGPRLAAFVFDTAVNMGERSTLKRLQYTLGVGQDGALGPRTLGALSARLGRTGAGGSALDLTLMDLRERILIDDFAFVRLGAYAGIVRLRPRSLKFLPSWVRRVDRVRATLAFPS